jgi:cell division septum initiation protein DivIVA
MPKKDKKASKKSREPADVVDAVRGAVERTFQATTGGTEGARDRGRSLLDDVASAAQRIRESFDDLRVLEDVRGLRSEIEALSRRVAELEKQVAAKPARASSTPRKAPAKPSAAGTAAKTTGAAAKPARKPAGSGTARKSAASGTARKPAARRTTSRKTTPAG